MKSSFMIIISFRRIDQKYQVRADTLHEAYIKIHDLSIMNQNLILSEDAIKAAKS